MLNSMPLVIKIVAGALLAVCIACIVMLILIFLNPKGQSRPKDQSPTPSTPAPPPHERTDNIMPDMKQKERSAPALEEPERAPQEPSELSHPSLEAFERQKKWIRLLAANRLKFLRELDAEAPGQTSRREQNALQALQKRVWKVGNWDDLARETLCEDAVGAANVAIVHRLYYLAGNVKSKDAICELLYLMDCLNGGAVPLEGESGLLPAGTKVKETVLSAMSAYADAHEGEEGYLSQRDLRRAMMEIESCEDLHYLGEKPKTVAVRVMTEYLADEVMELDNLDCMLSSDMKCWIRIMVQLMSGLPYSKAAGGIRRLLRKKEASTTQSPSDSQNA